MALTAAQVWDDYNTHNVPGSGNKEPDKAEIRAWGANIEAKNNAVTRVRVVATSNVALASGLAAGQTIDGVTLAENDVVLLPAQTASEENGVYLVPASGAASRTSSFNAYDNIAGTLFLVMEGTSNADTWWQCTSNKGGTIDSTALTITKRTGATGQALLADETPGDAQADMIFAGAFARTPAADGATDDVAALVALEASAQEVIRLKNATYYIGTDYTPTKTLRFSSTTRFLIADGVTVDFSSAQPEIRAAKKQHFEFAGTGTGAVSGLDEAHAGWFAGDKINTSNNALSELQKWADSVVTGGRLIFTLGYFTTDGSAYIQCSKGQQLEGRGRWNSRLRFSGTSTRGFEFLTAGRPTATKFGAFRADEFDVPTVGAVLLFSSGAREWEAESLQFAGCYRDIEANAAGHGKCRSFEFTDTRNVGLYVTDCSDNQFAQGIIAATSSWMVLSSVSGTFQNGETITYSGGSATIYVSGSKYKAIFTSTEPAIGATVTGSTSGATGTVDSITHPHAVGAIRLYEQCEANLFSDIDAVGGVYALTMAASVYSAFNRPIANSFTACLFDSAKSAGVSVAQSIGTKFVGCWFSNRPADNDVYIVQSDGTIFEACQWTNSWNRAMLCEGTALNTQIIGGFVSDYNRSNTAGRQAFLFAANSTGKMRGTIIGIAQGYSGNPDIGVQLNAGAAWELDGVDASACPTPIVNNSGGTSKIRNCKGYKTYNAGTTSVTTDAAGEANVAHGLSETPIWANARTQGDTVNEFQVISMDATNIRVRLRSSTTNADVSGTVGCTWEARAASAV